MHKQHAQNAVVNAMKRNNLLFQFCPTTVWNVYCVHSESCDAKSTHMSRLPQGRGQLLGLGKKGHIFGSFSLQS